MTFQQFVKEFAIKKQQSSLKATKDVKTLVNLLSEKIVSKETIQIPGFGTFVVLQYPSRTVKNPRDPGKKMVILAQNVVKFHSSSNLKSQLSNIKWESPMQNITKKIFIPYADLSKITVPKEILSQIPEHIARHYQVVPIEEKDNALVVAMIDPEDEEVIEMLKKKTGKKIERRITTMGDLSHVLDQYSNIGAEVEKIVEEEVLAKGKPKEEIKEKPEEIPQNAPAAKIVSSLLKRAVHDKASDIHIEPEEKDVAVRFRIDGVLRRIISLPKDINAALISRFKILCNLKIDETRLPQDGRFRATVDRAEIDFRVSTLPTVFGEKVVARILDKSAGVLTLDQLGLRGRSFEILKDNIKKSHGMILVTGPTGSGKTTTLYAIIDQIQNEGINIVTLEDPVEYQMPGINQSQVNAEIKYTFATGLRSIVRQDPDVIMIGEIRDYETANMAVHAALTGHVVLSTLHTNDASGAIPRLIDMKIEPFLITSTLNVVIAQRLCRKICENCKKEIPPAEDKRALIEQEIRNLPKEERKETEGKKYTLFHGEGCNLCSQTGYKGRIGIFEILPLQESLKMLINQRVSSDQIAKEALKLGMLTLKQDGILKVIAGVTTLDEVYRVTKD